MGRTEVKRGSNDGHCPEESERASQRMWHQLNFEEWTEIAQADKRKTFQAQGKAEAAGSCPVLSYSEGKWHSVLGRGALWSALHFREKIHWCGGSAEAAERETSCGEELSLQGSIKRWQGLDQSSDHWFNEDFIQGTSQVVGSEGFLKVSWPYHFSKDICPGSQSYIPPFSSCHFIILQ